MTLPHIHLLLNHVPTIGTAIAIGLLVLTVFRKHDALRRASLELFSVVALLTIPAYLSGVGSQLRVEEQIPEVSVLLMQRHHDAAVLASIMMLLTGGVAWVGLWQFRRINRQTASNLIAVFALSLLTMAAMARTATMGGEIRHPEIVVQEVVEDLAEEGFSSEPAASEPSLDDPAVADTVEQALQPNDGFLSAAWINMLVNGQVWLWPALETLHFIGLWLIFGVIVLVNARMLGLMTNTPYAALHRLLPWAALGLGVNTISGMMFIIAAPGAYANPTFYWKIALLVIAGINLIYLTVFDGPWEVKAGDRAPFRVRAMSASAIALWIGVMYFGRMLPFLGDAF